MWSRRTSDGITFSDVTTVTMNGLGISGSANCDFAYDYNSSSFAGAIPLPGEPGSRDSNAIRLADINGPDMLAGGGTWVMRGDISTSITGSFINSSPGILRDIFGNYSFNYPQIQVASSRGSNDPLNWDIFWTAHQP